MGALVAALGAPAAQAQRADADALVVGRVLEDSTGASLRDANVFVPGGTAGDAAGAGGQFAFRVRPGPEVQVRASVVGYASATVSTDMAPGDTVRIEFRLRRSTAQLAELPVTAVRDRGRERALGAFRDAFVGRTPNARRARIVNPEALRLDLDWHRLSAVGEAPLVLENVALGYEVVVHDLRLEAGRGGARDWLGHVRFADTCRPACGAGTLAARGEAYRGSLLHFLRAAAAGRLVEEGFEARRSRGTPGAGLFAAHETYGGALVARRAGGVWTLDVGRAARVTYTGPDGPEESWLAADGGEVRFTAEGRILNGREVRRYGQWDVERMADRLPHDYGAAPE